MEIKYIGRPECKIIREHLEVALGAALEDLGLKADLGNMTYDGSKVSFKTTIILADVDVAKEEFEKNCFLYDLKKSDYGMQFVSQGETFELCGIKPRAKKFPLVAKNVRTGKRYKFPRRAIKTAA